MKPCNFVNKRINEHKLSEGMGRTDRLEYSCLSMPSLVDFTEVKSRIR